MSAIQVGNQWPGRCPSSDGICLTVAVAVVWTARYLAVVVLKAVTRANCEPQGPNSRRTCHCLSQ
eukprot:2856743-Rhodomonas_salina.1